MNLDIGTIKDGQRSIGNCSLGNGVWRRFYVNPREASEVRHFLVYIRTMQQDHFECMLHELVEMITNEGESMIIHEDFNSVDNRPWEELLCGCVHFPSFTEGCWADNFGEGPRVWQTGTHFQAWTDTSGCREGHEP